jgi:hypothetical protein
VTPVLEVCVVGGGSIYPPELVDGLLRRRAFRAALSASWPSSIPVALTAPPAIGAALLAHERVMDVDLGVHDRLLGEIAGSAVP